MSATFYIAAITHHDAETDGVFSVVCGHHHPTEESASACGEQIQRAHAGPTPRWFTRRPPIWSKDWEDDSAFPPFEVVTNKKAECWLGGDPRDQLPINFF